jgi:hypothetical protein
MIYVDNMAPAFVPFSETNTASLNLERSNPAYLPGIYGDL